MTATYYSKPHPRWTSFLILFVILLTLTTEVLGEKGEVGGGGVIRVSGWFLSFFDLLVLVFFLALGMYEITPRFFNFSIDCSCLLFTRPHAPASLSSFARDGVGVGVVNHNL